MGTQADENGDVSEMNDVGPITRTRAAAPSQPARQLKRTDAAAAAPRSADRAEFSKAAQLLSRLAELPDVRQDLVERVRAEIAAGTYETPEKIDTAIDKLIEESI